MTQIGSEKKGKALKNHSAISKILLLLLCSEATLPWPVVTITLDMNHHPNSRQRSTIITDHLQNLACALRWYCSGVCLLACPIQLGSPTALIILGPWSKLVWLEFIQVLFFLKLKEKRMVLLWPWVWEEESAEIAAPSWTTVSLSGASTNAEKQSSTKRAGSWGYPEAPVQLGLTQAPEAPVQLGLTQELPCTSQLLQVIPFLSRLCTGLSDTCLRKESSFLPLNSILILSENKILLFLSDKNANVIQKQREIPVIVVEWVLWQSRARGSGKMLAFTIPSKAPSDITSSSKMRKLRHREGKCCHPFHTICGWYSFQIQTHLAEATGDFLPRGATPESSVESEGPGRWNCPYCCTSDVPWPSSKRSVHLCFTQWPKSVEAHLPNPVGEVVDIIFSSWRWDSRH